jgi:hypothetical protein
MRRSSVIDESHSGLLSVKVTEQMVYPRQPKNALMKVHLK